MSYIGLVPGAIDLDLAGRLTVVRLYCAGETEDLL
jgi:hypothetical protein